MLMKAAAILTIQEGPGEGSDCPLYECVATIGSDQSNTIAFDFGDGAISRIPHAAIEVEGNSATIADGEKARAIKVGSHALRTAIPLDPGSLIQSGSTLLCFVESKPLPRGWLLEQTSIADAEAQNLVTDSKFGPTRVSFRLPESQMANLHQALAP